MPSGMPITSAITMASITISSVCGKQRTIEVSTGSLETSDVDRSPCDGFPQPRAVLDQERPVEAVEMPDLRNSCVGSIVAGERHGDVARHQLQQGEYDECREHDHRHRLDQAARDDAAFGQSATFGIRFSSAQPDMFSNFGLPSRSAL